MKHLYSALLLTLMAASAYAQTYRLMTDEGYALYDNGEDLRAIRVDSTVAEGGDIVQYLSKTIQSVDPDDPYCVTPFGASWIGPEIRVLSDGTQLLTNLHGDTVRLETQREAGESWMAYAVGDLNIRAEISTVEFGTVLGEPDSIKTITFQALDQSLSEIQLPINDLSIAVSREHGLTQTLNFYAFPNGNESFYQLPLEEYDLAGREGSDGGVGNLTWKDVYDFQPGDELHVRQGNKSFGIGTEYQYIFRYLERDAVGDSIRYMVEISYDIYDISGAEMTYTQSSVDTSEAIIWKHEAFDEWSMVPYISIGSWQTTANYFRQKSGSPARKTTREEATTIFYSEDDAPCWYPSIDGGCPDGSSTEYIENRGGPYYDCHSGAAHRNYRILEYSLIGGVETGTPFDLILKTTEPVEETVVRIHPNPASDRLNITVNSSYFPAVYTLTDIQGRGVKRVKITAPENHIDVSDLPAGMYVYSLENSRGFVSTGKLVVE